VLDVRVCGGVEVEVDGHVLPEPLIGGRQGRLVLAYLVCERDRPVRREELADLLWPDRLPDSWTASLSAVISRLRRLFSEAGMDGQQVITSAPGAYQLMLPPGGRVDIEELASAVATAEDAAARGDTDRALAAVAGADAIAARGFLADDCEWVDTRRAAVRDLRVRAAIAQSVAHLHAGGAGRAIEAARHAVALDPAKEAAYRQLMRALTAAGERGEALRVWERCRIALVEELGVDPSPETEAVYLQLIDATPPAVTTELPSGVVTFFLTDIVESSALWEEHPDAMAKALERHDTIIGDTVAAHGGTLLKSKLEGDATVSVFARATGAATAALALLDALAAEPWPEGAAPRLRMAMHTGEAFERGGDYFGPALNRAARLRALAGADEVLCSQAVAELVRDHLPPGTALHERGHRNLRGLSRGENVFQLARATVDNLESTPRSVEPAIARPPVPAVLAGAGPFVGRADEQRALVGLWDECVAGNSRAALIGGEPGVGKSRLAGEIAQHAYAAGALVLYGRCDEDLAAPLQPFIEALRMLAPALGAARLREARGIDELARVVPEVGELLPDASPSARADPDSERLALFDAVTQLIANASTEAPVLLVLDDLHWAGKTTLSLLRHVLREARDHRVFVVGTYRDTELARTHPLAATLADLRRESNTHRIALGGLAAADVDAYLTAIGNTDRALGRELAEITSGNPFFLIEVVRHVEETGGAWQPGTLPEGVREATGRRLSRLSDAANDALAVAAVVGTTFNLALVEQVRGTELVDPIAEACQAGLVMEEPGTLGRFRFAHALVRQVLLAELVSLKRVRLHRTIAELLEAAPSSNTDADARLADLAYHWFECASAGSADRAVTACQRAADRAMERVAYEEAGDLYGMALQALEWIDDADDATRAALHLARCDALLTAGDVGGARSAIDALELAAAGSERLAAWYTTYEGLFAVLGEPDRLTEIVRSIGAAAEAMRAVGDLVGEAKAHYVHASALERLGQIGAAERALDAALAAARAADDLRLADTILAETPPAHLWGPSPVMRASGRCLDVVRVLRITSGAPAVEAVALRCQAVLEALRGRMEAARRMIRSAHRTVEQLGLTHRRLETDVAAGLIELLDGEAAVAEHYLRPAYDELRERGLGGEAAQAGAFLGRALLMQERVDEADAIAAEAETLAGSDLKAAIAWRGVRAEVAARRGGTERALFIAREAVELATATDALLLIADARLALATVLRTAGDATAADAEARRAVEACERKGATVLAARARAALPDASEATSSAALAPVATHPASTRSSAFENDATRRLAQIHAAFNAHDWDALMANYSGKYTMDDSRPIIGRSLNGSQAVAGLRVVFDGRGHFEDEAIATRGRSLALTRTTLRIPSPEATDTVLIATELDDDGLFLRSTMFDANDVDGAIAKIDDMFVAGEGAPHADVLRLASAFFDAQEGHDIDAIRALLAPEFVHRDHRRAGTSKFVAEDWLTLLHETYNFVSPTTVRVEHVAELSSLGGLWACVSTGTHETGGPWEVSWLVAMRVTNGRISSLDFFDEHDVEAARAVLGSSEPFENTAWRASVRNRDACNRRDWQGLLDNMAPGFVYADRHLVHLEGDDTLVNLRFLFTLDQFTWEGSLLATRGELLALAREQVTFVDGDTGPAEFEGITMVECTPEGLLASNIGFDIDQLDAAYAALDARYVELGGPNLRPFSDAFNRRDWQRFSEFFAPDYTYLDSRVGGLGTAGRDDFVAYVRGIVDMAPDVVLRYDHVVAHNARVALTIGSHVGTHDGAPFEMQVASVASVAADGRLTAVRVYPVDDLDSAKAEYDRRTQPSWDEQFQNAAIRAARRFEAASNAQDWSALVAVVSPRFEMHDRRASVAIDATGEEAIATFRVGLGLDEYHMNRVVIATRGNFVALVRDLISFRDGVSGPAELEVLTLVEADDQDRTAAHFVFDEDDLDAALDELDARYIATSTTVDLFENTASRATGLHQAALHAKDWQAFLATVAPNFTYSDRRSGIATDYTGDDALAVHRAAFELDEARIDRHVLATRGDSLALYRSVTHLHDGATGPAEVEVLGITETDADGRWVRQVLFDVDDIDTALDELDARDAALGGNPLGAVMRHAIVARDWEALRAVMTPDCTFRDYRTAGWGPITPDAFVDFQRSVGEISPDTQLWTDHARSRDNVYLSIGRVFGTRAGGPWEIAFAAVAVCQADHRTTHLETYELDDIAHAQKRFAELAPPETAPPAGNLAWRAAQRHDVALNSKNWDAMVATLAPDNEVDDRRTGISLVVTGEEALRSVHRIAFTLDRCWSHRDLIATRGDRLALVRSTIRFEDGQAGPAEVQCFNLFQVDEHGRVTNLLAFDLDDLAGATDELNARAAALGDDL
jgi:DNA-binding SARP family transcriptional activator